MAREATVNPFLAADLVIGAHDAVQQAIEFGWFFGPGLLLAAAGSTCHYAWERWADRRERRLAARIAEADARMPQPEPDDGLPRIDTRPGIDRDARATCEAIWNADKEETK